MNTIGQRLKDLRKETTLTGKELADKLDVTAAAVSQWESDKRVPDNVMLVRLANLYNTTVDYILGNSRIRATAPNLTSKDERDIQARIAEITADLESTEGLAFYNGGEPMSAEDMELLKISLENSVRLAKQLAKAREK